MEARMEQHDKPKADIMLNREKLKAFHLKFKALSLGAAISY